MKKRIYSILGVMIVIIVAFGFKLNSDSRKDYKQSNDAKEVTKQDAINNVEKQIKSFADQAKRGTMSEYMGIVGETTLEDVTDQWGISQNVIENEMDSYMAFPEHDITIGVLENTVFEVRHTGSELKNIHYKDLQKTLGEPDKTTTYQDNIVDQVILIYQVNQDYQLKWKMMKPTEAVPNPSIDYVAVWKNIESKMERTLAKMTLDEKIGQLIIAGIDGTSINESSKKLIEQYKVGGFIFYANNAENPEQTKGFVNSLKVTNEVNRLPLFMSIDQEGGSVARLPKQVERLPTAAAIGKKNDVDYAFNVGRTLGKQLTEFGFNMNFAPVLDVNSNPNNPVIGDRSFSPDPNVVSLLGIQTMKGINEQGVIPVVKHFPGHGDTSVDSHLELPKVDKTLEQLDQLELIPFKKAIEADVDVIMVAHILLSKLDENNPATMSLPIMTDLLRNKLGFSGLVMTDDMTMKAITNHYGIADAAVQSITAGSDVLLVAHDPVKVIAVIEALKEAVAMNDISIQRIDKSVARVIELKEKYALDDKKTP